MNTTSLKRSGAQFIGSMVAGVLFAASSQASVTAYAFTDLGTLGGTTSAAYSINNLGQVVGESSLSSNVATHATLWNGTVATDLGAFGGHGSLARGINNSGQIVGNANFDDGPHAIRWNGGATTDLGAAPGVLQPSLANAINDLGQVVGYSGLDLGYVASQATVWNGATATVFGIRGGLDSGARGINNSGQIVGNDGGTPILWDGGARIVLPTNDAITYAFPSAINDSGKIVGDSNLVDKGGVYATLWDGDTVTNLDPLNTYTGSEANAINNSGEIVGVSYIVNELGSGHATFWNGATAAVDLNSLLDTGTVNAGWVLISASDINDKGAIVGTASNSVLGIDSHAFLLTPVPEPDTYALLLAGLGLVGFIGRRKKRSISGASAA
ncbi:MAG: PEP-CTERM sorting domain-containing protein [Nitrosospira sp.]